MNIQTLQRNFLVFFLQAGLCGFTYAEIYYQNDFESGVKPVTGASNPSPLWSLPLGFDKEYGPGNFFEVTTAAAHTGNYSLRFNYGGKNSFCNTCDEHWYKHISTGHDGASYFVENDGIDLKNKDNITKAAGNGLGPAAAPGKLVYNTTAGYSLWEIESVANQNATNDRLNLKLLKNGIGSEPAVFNAGDSVAIARECGVDGTESTLGGNFDVNRRSDCNNVISWFVNVHDQAPGTSIYRRTYLKAEVSSLRIRQKLHYLRHYYQAGNLAGKLEGTLNGEVVLFGDSNRGKMEPELTGLAPYGGTLYKPGNGLDAALEFERGVWYYIEEQYLAESSEGAGDGAYRLWFAKAGSEPVSQTGTALIEATGLTLPPIIGSDTKTSDISFWGNFQHSVHAVGSWYMDDIIISDTWSGAAAGGGSNKLPPNPPTAN
ncbi:MAG: hypothetical protein OEZ38_01655 [Gammaproteobacteria bacterium]|nr:hypothetical protein [Gammaproteobacteria bacterium]